MRADAAIGEGLEGKGGNSGICQITKVCFGKRSLQRASMNCCLRNYRSEDAVALNAVALAAFLEFQSEYADWAVIGRAVGNMANLAEGAEIVVATVEEVIVGGVAYVGPTAPRAAYFRPDWAIIRMLVVSPAWRGRGVGRALTEECIRRGVRDNAAEVALHTSAIMKVALPMYLRMGFEWRADAPDISGVAYSIYAKEISKRSIGDCSLTD